MTQFEIIHADYLAILLVRKEYKDLKIVYSIYVFLTTTHVILRNRFIIRCD
jgi:collagenase-like PrtC family protease